MKLLLIFTLCLIASCAFAQNSQTPPGENDLVTLERGTGLYLNRNDSMIAIMKKYLEYSKQGSGIINLSQDNMPCVIPNSRLMIPMNNLWKGRSPYRKKSGSIPNSADPLPPKEIPLG